MPLSILGGLLKGHRLSLPSNDIVRPTAASLKRKIFDAFQDFEDLRFIDLCAGSGSVGIEAWSRGASDVICVEGNKKAHAVLKSNCELASKHYPDELGLRPMKPIFGKCERWLSQNSSQLLSPMTIIYLDPPYEKKDIYLKTIQSLIDQNYQGELWLEGCSQKGQAPKYWCELLEDKMVKVYEQGSAYIIRFKFAV